LGNEGFVKRIINENGVDREMTQEEVFAYEAFFVEKEKELQRIKDEEKARLDLATLALSKLGLTEEEVKILFG
jgi:hypothetical protein